MAEPVWKEGEEVSVALDGEEPRKMRVVRVRRTRPNTVDLTLEAVSAPAGDTEALPPVTITCLCRPDVSMAGQVRGIRTNERCSVHGLPQYRDHDGPRLLEAHQRIARLPKEERHEAMRRASRSYSAPRTCVEHDGCHVEGSDMVWPDGERWPTRTERTPAPTSSPA